MLVICHFPIMGCLLVFMIYRFRKVEGQAGLHGPAAPPKPMAEPLSGRAESIGNEQLRKEFKALTLRLDELQLPCQRFLIVEIVIILATFLHLAGPFARRGALLQAQHFGGVSFVLFTVTSETSIQNAWCREEIYHEWQQRTWAAPARIPAGPLRLQHN
jgi:hypothetical protein